MILESKWVLCSERLPDPDKAYPLGFYPIIVRERASEDSEWIYDYDIGNYCPGEGNAWLDSWAVDNDWGELKFTEVYAWLESKFELPKY